MRKYKMKRTNLNETAWIEQGTVEDFSTFDELWNLHPENFGKVKMFGKLVDTPRWQQSYLQDYVFSGLRHEAIALPTELHHYLDWANKLGYGKFSQVLLNWYSDGHHYIGAHKDDEKQLVQDSPIVSISLGEVRKFRIRDNAKNTVMDIDMNHGSVVVMGGTLQHDFYHEVVKVNGKKGESLGRRINLTFRQFE